MRPERVVRGGQIDCASRMRALPTASFPGLILLGSLACGGGSECGKGTHDVDGECVPDDTDVGGDSDSGTDDSGGGDAVAPTILSLTTNVTSLTQGESVTITAVVTDPQGISDLIGGQLQDSGGGTYGAFATASDEGSCSLVLSWDAIGTVAPITFDGQDTRTVVAVFYDQAGNEASEELTLTLTCDTGTACDSVCGMGECGGSCVDLQNDAANCGQCGETCDSDVCATGRCGVWSECFDQQRESELWKVSAADICIMLGGECVEYGGDVRIHRTTLTCSGYSYYQQTCGGRNNSNKFDGGQVLCFYD